MFLTRTRGACERCPRPRNPAAKAVAITAAALLLASLGMMAVQIDATGGPAQNSSDAVTLDGLLTHQAERLFERRIGADPGHPSLGELAAPRPR